MFSVSGETSTFAPEPPLSANTSSRVDPPSRRGSQRKRASITPPHARSRSSTSAATLAPGPTPTYVPGGPLHASPNMQSAVLTPSPDFPPSAFIPSPVLSTVLPPGYDYAGKIDTSPHSSGQPLIRLSHLAHTHAPAQEQHYTGQYTTQPTYNAAQYPGWSSNAAPAHADQYPHGMVTYAPDSLGSQAGDWSGSDYSGSVGSWSAAQVSTDMQGQYPGMSGMTQAHSQPHAGYLQHRMRAQTWAPTANTPPVPHMPVHSATLPSPTSPMDYYAAQALHYAPPSSSTAYGTSHTPSYGGATVGVQYAHYAEQPIPRLSHMVSPPPAASNYHYNQSAPGPSPPRR
jgi:hypothetical protein